MRPGRVLIGLFATMLSVAAPGLAQEAVSEDEAARKARIAAARKADTEEAWEILVTSLRFLESQPALAYTAHSGYDVYQTNGQQLEFGGQRDVVMRRPDRLRVNHERRNGRKTSLYYDGQNLSVDIPDETAYAMTKRTGELDEVIDYLEKGLGAPTPTLEFLRTNLADDLQKSMAYGLWVGEEKVGGKNCDHLAFQNERVDFQLWIELGERPLPLRMIVTYKHELGSPQFRAHFTKWDLEPDTPDALFVYDPPEGAERIPFAPRPKRQEEVR